MKFGKKEQKRSSIFRKVFGRLVLVGILPIITIAIAGGIILYLAYHQSAEDFEKTLLAQKRVEVDRYVRETLKSFELYINLADQSDLLTNCSLSELLEGYLLAYPNLDEVSFIKTFPTSLLSRERGTEELEQCYEESLLAHEQPSGKEMARIVRDSPEHELRSFSNDGAYLQAREGRSSISWVVWKNNIPVVRIMAPVRQQGSVEAADNLIAVLTGELNLSGLQQFFQSSSFGREGAFYLLDEQGHVLAHSGAVAELFQDAANVRDEASTSGSIITTTTLSGKRSLVVAVPATLTKWTFIAEWPVTDAFGPLINLLWQSAFIAVLLGAAIFLFSTRQAHEIVNPIRLLQAAAARIGRGELWGSIEVQTRDELQDLGESLQRMAGDLARLQEIRSTEVRAQALAQAVEKEQELDEAKDSLLTNASHQFRTPISVLNWNIDLLKTMQLPPDAAPLLEGIAEHAGNLSAIAGDLLNATAFGSGYVAQEGTAPVDLAQILNEVLDRYHIAAERKKLRVSRQFPETPLMVVGSYGALRILFEALVANAVTYTNEGGEIQVVVQEQPDGTIACSLRDTGIGIPKMDQDKLFTAFFRASNAIVAKNVGTGLGLFVARNIAAGHRGSIFVGSEEGKGTEFIVVLPRAENPKS